MMADRIRGAKTEQEVSSSLVAHIEAVRGRGKYRYLPVGGATSPSGAVGLTQCRLAVVGGLDAASRHSEDQAWLALKQALHVFSNALTRIIRFARAPERLEQLLGQARVAAVTVCEDR